MPSKTTKKGSAIMDSLKKPVDSTAEEIPTVVPDSDAELELFQAPDEMQYRRTLTGPELTQWVAMQAQMNSGDERDIGISIFDQIATAISLDDVLDAKSSTVKSKEILNTVLQCHSIRFMNSGLKDGCPWFALIDVSYGPENTRETISVGGWMAVAQLGAMHYRCAPLTANSPYRVDPEAPGAVTPETFPLFFKIGQKETPKGHMNFLMPAMAL